MSQPRYPDVFATTRSPTRTSATKGEEVLSTLYAKACEDRDAYASTNAMYSKMLEACAEQNNVAERAAQAAKREALEATEQAAAAIQEKNAAIAKLQSIEAEFLVRVSELESTLAARISQEAERINAIQAEHLIEMTKASEELSKLSVENERLRASYIEASSEAAFTPRKITHKGNEVRAELAVQLAALSEEIAKGQKQLTDANEAHLAELKANSAAIEALRKELLDAHAATLREKEGKHQADAAHSARIHQLEQQVAQESEARRRAEESAIEANLRREEILTNAQSTLDERERAFAQELADAQHNLAVAESRFAAQLEALSTDFQKRVSELDTRAQTLSLENATLKEQLSRIQVESLGLKKELAASTKSKNVALRDLRDQLWKDVEAGREALDNRSQEVAALHAKLNDMLAHERSHANSINEMQTRLDAARTAEQDAQNVISALQRTLADKDASIVELTAHVSRLDQELLEADRHTHQNMLKAKTEGQREAEQISSIQASFKAQIQALKADFASEIQRAKAAEQEARTNTEAELKRMKEVLAYNADLVEKAAEANKLIAEANAKAASLEEELAKHTAKDTQETPGSKRRRR